MQDWEFSIQEKGDRRWHIFPLSPLGEGTYRMVARSPYPHSPVEVEVTFTDTTSAHAKTVLQQARVANERGLIGIFPYRLLPSGRWTVTIAGQAPEGAWQKEISFEVLAQPAAAPDFGQAGDGSSAAPPARAELETTPVFENNAVALDVPPVELPRLAIALDPVEINDAVSDYIWVAGKVSAIAPESALAFPARLRYRLYHPESGEVLLDEPKSWLPNLQSAVPFAFQESLAVPADLDIEILRGEVIVETLEQTLAAASFDLEINLVADDWSAENAINYTIQLSNLENQSSVIFDVMVPKEIAETPLEINLPNPALMKGLLRRSPQLDRPILPPKIAPAIAAPQKKNLQLPKIHT